MKLWKNNFDWICPENPCDESSEPKSVHKRSSKTHLDTLQLIVKRLLQLILMSHLILLDFHLSAPSSKALKKSTLGR
jgi:hypothetical protein